MMNEYQVAVHTSASVTMHCFNKHSSHEVKYIHILK